MIRRLLIANRGEIAVRIARTAAELGIVTVGVAASDDACGGHTHAVDEVIALAGSGPPAYLDIAALVAAAASRGCDALHPGYGFLSERADLPEACARAGLTFVGPDAETLATFGDKAATRRLARRLGLPLPAGADAGITPEQAAALLAGLPPGRSIVLKALRGGGGRGMRVVSAGDDLAAAFAACAAEAHGASGDPALYAEEYVGAARHVEVQIAGDGTGVVAVLGDRDCSLQRRHQKLIEIAPAPGLSPRLRGALHDAAGAVGGAVALRGLATVEFLVGTSAEEGWFLLEVNPRLQVEHPLTEETTGLDLVAVQLRIAEGFTLAELGLGTPISPRGTAVELRVCAERYDGRGAPLPTAGTVAGIRWPTGPGVRIDTAVDAGAEISGRYDSLVAKVIVHSASPEPSVALDKLRRSLGELHIEGVLTNREVVLEVLRSPELADTVGGPDGSPQWPTTQWLEPILGQLGSALGELPATVAGGSPANLAVARGDVLLVSPVPGLVVSIGAPPGAPLDATQTLVVIESMKMEHVVTLPVAGWLTELFVTPGTIVATGEPLASYTERGAGTGGTVTTEVTDLDVIRSDLAEVIARHSFGHDANRPDAVARRRAAGQRTARENIADLLDEGSFVEYAPLVIAAQRRRRELDELIRRTPGDGMVGGLGRVNGGLFGAEVAQVAVMTYDYTVLAGTQGLHNHRKKDRLFDLAERLRLPVVLFAEGGGGRPGDTDGVGVAGLDCLAFWLFGRLSGLVPLVGITSGYCFAGNAALLGCCDVVIATEGSSIGMGGPAMIEGGGLGVYPPGEVGPVEDQWANGVVDLRVADEAAAVAAAKKYLSYFQGPLPDWEAADQRLLRSSIPENRVRVYDIRRVLTTMFDIGSLLELRRGFGPGMVTALARVEGRPLGVIANDPAHLGGAIDAPGADKAARFVQLCDAFDLPVVSLCDTPGFMVGPAAEREALVRKAARLFVTTAGMTVPMMTIVLRKGYGLGAQAMAGGSFRAPLFTISWPTGEFGGMGLEGAVRLGYRKELEAITDPEERRRVYEEMVARMYAVGKATNVASVFEIDEVIDPADSRRWISALLDATPPSGGFRVRPGKKRPQIDTW